MSRSPNICAGIALCAAIGLGVTALQAVPATADVPIDRVGSSVALPHPPNPHWVWASDPLMQRITLVDLESGAMLGQINGGFGFSLGEFSQRRSEIVMPETHYSRGTRGERTDVATFYDAATLFPVAEVVLPPRRAINPLPGANAAMTDDERFLMVLNMTPATSVSVVDAVARTFTAEISTPGCSLVYAAGDRRFASLCQNGELMLVTLDDSGREQSKTRHGPFFDPEADPITEKAVRHGDTWWFVSFDGVMHGVDVSGDEPKFPERWSLFDDADRADNWRVGGPQHLALHEATGRLFALVHQGGVDTHKDLGSELWIYDLESRERAQRLELVSPGLTFLGQSMEFGADWMWPFSGLYDAMLGVLASEIGVGQVVVTQDDAPLLVTGSIFTGSLAVYDALSGEFLRRVISGNMTTQALQAPWGGK